MLFEQILNLFGELSLFGDREFYQDWWNSDGFADFSRKWNRPVHLFLHKHVYQEAINEYKWKPQSARHLTFLLSALCHEFLSSSDKPEDNSVSIRSDDVPAPPCPDD